MRGRATEKNAGPWDLIDFFPSCMQKAFRERKERRLICKGFLRMCVVKGGEGRGVVYFSIFCVSIDPSSHFVEGVSHITSPNLLLTDCCRFCVPCVAFTGFVWTNRRYVFLFFIFVVVTWKYIPLGCNLKRPVKAVSICVVRKKKSYHHTVAD